MKHHLTASIIVCSYNGAGHLAQTIRALQQQSYPKHLYGIVVVDDGSTDQTADIAKSLGVQVERHATNQGIGVARNTGLKSAKGEIIAFTDDDCLPDSGWLENLLKPYVSPEVMATAGRTVAVTSATPTERYMDVSGYGNPAPYSTRTNTSPISRLFNYTHEMIAPLHSSLTDGQALEAIYTLNASYRAKALRAIGGFDSTLRAAEDSDVSARLYETFPESRIVFASQAIVGHRHRNKLWPWVMQTFERSQDDYRQIRKDGRIPPIFPSPILTVLTILVVAITKPAYAAITLLASPIIFFWWWQIRPATGHPLDRLRFPLMQLLLEGASLGGFTTAFLKGFFKHA